MIMMDISFFRANTELSEQYDFKEVNRTKKLVSGNISSFHFTLNAFTIAGDSQHSLQISSRSNVRLEQNHVKI